MIVACWEDVSGRCFGLAVGLWALLSLEGLATGYVLAHKLASPFVWLNLVLWAFPFKLLWFWVAVLVSVAQVQPYLASGKPGYGNGGGYGDSGKGGGYGDGGKGTREFVQDPSCEVYKLAVQAMTQLN